jgi:hypothetical protein
VLHKLNSAATLIQRPTTEAPRDHMYYQMDTMSNKIKRPDCDEDFDSPAEIEEVNERERIERRAKNTPPKVGVNFTEAVGKVVAFVNVINDPPGLLPHRR